LRVYFLACVFIGLKTFNVGGLDENNQSKSEVSVNVSSSRMTYGRFLEYLEMGWVKQVDLYDNSRNAIVQALVQSLEIDLSQSGNTYGCFTTYPKLKEYNINFDAHPAPRKVFS
jgi:cell division protease FtsH